MASTDILSNFQKIKVESPIDKIIQQMQGMIPSGHLNPGDKLPSIPKLSEKLGVSRSHVREAIRKLEFYGILKLLPQNGTGVAGMGITALEGLISDPLKIDNSDFTSLVETRVMLETESAKLAALRRTDQDIIDISTALNAHATKLRSGQQAVEEDLMFHLKIAEASKNSVLKSLMLIITPDIIRNFIQLDICNDERTKTVLDEHEVILQHIVAQEPEEAAAAMRRHLQEVLDYSRNLKNRQSNGEKN